MDDGSSLCGRADVPHYNKRFSALIAPLVVFFQTLKNLKNSIRTKFPRFRRTWKNVKNLFWTDVEKIVFFFILPLSFLSF